MSAGWRDSRREPLAVGLGVPGLEVAPSMWLTTRLRDRIRYRAWSVSHRTVTGRVPAGLAREARWVVRDPAARVRDADTAGSAHS